MTARVLIATALAALALPAAASAAPEVILKVDPTVANRGDRIAAAVGFRGFALDARVQWAVDNQPVPKFEGLTEVTAAFKTLGSHTITVSVSDKANPNGVPKSQNVLIVNAVPVAKIAADADAPLTNQAIALSSASTDGDRDALTCQWDLDGDGTFETAGCAATQAYAKAGAYIVGLRVSDGIDSATALRGITVSDPPVEPAAVAAPLDQPAPLLAPAPLPQPKPVAPGRIAATLRYAFNRTATSATFTSLIVRNVPVGASVKASCRGGGCAKKPFAAIAKSDTVSLKALTKRTLKAGASITVEIAKAGMTGRSVTLTVRKGKDPKLAAK